jgi:hypothetical protein
LDSFLESLDEFFVSLVVVGAVGALGGADALDVSDLASELLLVLDELEPTAPDDDLRLSVIYQPDPLKIIPAAWITLRTLSDAQVGHSRIGSA